jgi:hypothetical protein
MFGVAVMIESVHSVFKRSALKIPLSLSLVFIFSHAM